MSAAVLSSAEAAAIAPAAVAVGNASDPYEREAQTFPRLSGE